MLGCLSIIASISSAILAGLGYYSFWWTVIPAFFAGAFALSNSPGHYAAIIRANERGNIWLFPVSLSLSVGTMLAVAGVVFWATSLLR